MTVSWKVSPPPDALLDPRGPDGQGRNRPRIECCWDVPDKCRLRPRGLQSLWSCVARGGEWYHLDRCDWGHGCSTCPRVALLARGEALLHPGCWREDERGRCWELNRTARGWGEYGLLTPWTRAVADALATVRSGRGIHWSIDDHGDVVTVDAQ